MAERIAQCGCGRVRVVVNGDPSYVLRCHCDFCQKLSGTLFQAAAVFDNDQVVELSGDTHVYDGKEIDGVGVQLPGDVELSVRKHFCPTCGSTVYWRSEGFDDIRLGVGCFVDPSFPQATLEMHTASRHQSVPPVPGAKQYESWPGA